MQFSQQMRIVMENKKIDKLPFTATYSSSDGGMMYYNNNSINAFVRSRRCENSIVVTILNQVVDVT